MALAYYGVRLSDNWVETPEGYVVFKNAVIGRTGFQTYKGHELDRDEMDEQGISVKDEDDVQLFRSPEEVFSPKTIASFVGKSVTDGHPSELLSLENVKDHEQGQVFNIRQGTEPLESGDIPLMADLVVKSRNLIDKIKAGLRELSCGYNYHVLKDGNLIKQVDIVGNHVAIVEQARAGREAVIVDSAITSIERNFMNTWIDRILNSNSKAKLTAWAKDAKPEEIADAMTQLASELDTRPVPAVQTTIKVASVAKDEGNERDKWHKTLDRFLDGKEKEEEAADADIQALSDMFKPKSGNDVAADAADVATDEEEEEEKPKKADDEESDDEANDEEGALTIEPEDRPKSAGPGTDSLREARLAGAKDVIKLLKPIIAQSGNTKLIKAFDTASKTIQGKSRGNTTGGYGSVAEAASRRGKDANDSANASKREADQYAVVEKMYHERFNVVKRG